MIDQDTLHNTGAVLKKYQKGKLLFKEGDITHYYHQVHSGQIKMNNFHIIGKKGF